MNKQHHFLKETVSVVLFLFIFGTANQAFSQQSNTEQLSLSFGISAGYAPTLTFGNIDDSGAIVGLSGDLLYKNMIGQLDFVYVISETVSSEYFTSGMGFFGSLGYQFQASEKFYIPIMATGGASIIEYQVFNSYKDVSPQVGFTLAPYYMLNEGMSVFCSFRYMNGFKGSEESDPIDVMGVAVGLRFKLIQ